MFSPVSVVIDAFVAVVRASFGQAFPGAAGDHGHLLESTTRVALESLANSDAPYHDVEHTIMVTQVGQEILRGKQIADGGVSEDDWLHFVVSLLCHDIGYVRGVCRGDRGGRYVIDGAGHSVEPPRGATDAFMTPHHVDRGQIFVRERFGDDPRIDVEQVCRNIEHTRFPVPAGDDHERIDDYPGLVRAADLIGQLADPRYIQKLARLHAEFVETGEAERLGYASPADLRAAYPGFFWNVVSPYIPEGLRLLRRTQGGQQVIANLFAHVFEEEHEAPAYGPERREGTDRRQRQRPVAEDRNRRERPWGRRATDTAPENPPRAASAGVDKD